MLCRLLRVVCILLRARALAATKATPAATTVAAEAAPIDFNFDRA